MPSPEMTIAEHLDELRGRVFRIVIWVGVITIFSMTFGVKSVPVIINDHGINLVQNDTSIKNMKNATENAISLKLYYPYPDPLNNISLQLTSFFKNTLLPPEVRLIQIAPGQVFFAQVHISILLGLICGMPILVKELFGFISPALGKNIRLDFFKITIPIFCLFMIGALFSYIFVIPFTLNFLYQYGRSVGAETFLTVTDLITFVLQFVLGFGITFELPIIMYSLSLTGLVDSNFWRNNFRYAIILITIFGAVITPDGSGITMWFISLPMLVLYLLGILLIKNREKKLLIV